MAISFDSANTTFKTVSGSSSDSLAHTCTGSNRYLLVAMLDYVPNVTGVTYAGVSMTEIDNGAVSGDVTIRVFGLANPASGSNNITVTASGSATFVYGGVSYAGVSQVTTPDNKTKSLLTSQSSPFTTTLSTVADNCWTMLFVRNPTANITAGTGSTFRASDAGIDGRTIGFYDSNASITPAGSTSMGVTFSGSSTIGTIMVSIAPYVTVQNLTMTASVGAFTLTGTTTGLGRLYTMIASVGSFILTGTDAIFNVRGWTNQSKNSSSFSNQSKNSSSFSNQSKNTSSWSNQSKN